MIYAKVGDFPNPSGLIRTRPVGAQRLRSSEFCADMGPAPACEVAHWSRQSAAALGHLAWLRRRHRARRKPDAAAAGFRWQARFLHSPPP